MTETWTLKAFMCSGKEYTWTFSNQDDHKILIAKLKEHRHGWTDFKFGARHFHINRAHLVSLEEIQ